ncbi:hypothetical protein D3C81_1321250 [compost metagenome]
MQAGAGRLAHCIQVADIGAARGIGDHAAAGVVRGRHDRDRLVRDVDAQFQAARVDRREVFLQEGFGLVADVQVDAVQAALLHLEVDRARDHVARRQLGTLIVLGHEAGAVGQLEQPAFAAHRLGNQE